MYALHTHHTYIHTCIRTVKRVCKRNIPRGWYWSCKLSQRKVPSGKPYKITWLPLGRWESRCFSVCMTLEYICSGVVISGIGSALLRWKKQQVSDYQEGHIQNTLYLLVIGTLLQTTYDFLPFWHTVRLHLLTPLKSSKPCNWWCKSLWNVLWLYCCYK